MAFIKKPSVPLIPFIFIFFSFILLHHLGSAQEQQRRQQQQQQQQPQPQLEALSSLSFISDATELPTQEEYDFIIVGGGTAGCPLAATLSQNHRVLMVERGGHILEHPSLLTQEGFLQTLTRVDALDSPAEAFTSEDGVQNARGRVLGGSSSINAGFYSRSDQDFFRHSESPSNGISTWSTSPTSGSRRPSFSVQTSRTGSPPSEMALLKPTSCPTMASLSTTSSVPRLVAPYLIATEEDTAPPISSTKPTPPISRLLCTPPLNASCWTPNHSSSHRRRRRPRRGGRVGVVASAIGILYQDRAGRYHRAMVREKGGGEVILCAGALGSPQLLLLSGIGPRSYLSSMGIPVAHHLPHVGQFLYDNPRNGISILPPVPLDHSLIQVVGITESGTYIEAASNIVPFSPPPRNAFLHNPATPLYFTVATIMEKISGPLSVGSLRLASTDVKVSPVVRFNYFAEAEDLERCVRGMRKIGEVLRGRSLDDLKVREWFGGRDFRYVGATLPFNQSDDGLMEEFCRRTVTTIWHYHGGCVAGKVVDGKHRVIGVDKLRVVDGSTFPISPGTNPQATVMMLGR
ncbi:hypothetical protein Syun_010845 [Stephania yunnanensis]|uniref:Glucose-methanol-choline oxidoreductase N-terminal domain-containing protein n=1 Tax=Stephania yunnanensis TaxID=152371 RepID=A0AAP0PHP6_9MAGN